MKFLPEEIECAKNIYNEGGNSSVLIYVDFIDLDIEEQLIYLLKARQLLKEKNKSTMLEFLPKMQACFVNSESPPIVVEHICWYVTQRYDVEKRTNMLDLNEMVKETYPHPDAPDDAVVFVITNRPNKYVRLENGAELLLLKSACDTVSKLNNETVIPRPLSSENEMSDI